jgi:hypothetical protein
MEKRWLVEHRGNAGDAVSWKNRPPGIPPQVGDRFTRRSRSIELCSSLPAGRSRGPVLSPPFRRTEPLWSLASSTCVTKPVIEL